MLTSLQGSSIGALLGNSASPGHATETASHICRLGQSVSNVCVLIIFIKVEVDIAHFLSASDGIQGLYFDLIQRYEKLSPHIYRCG
jgi:hypothetical protein